MITGLCNEAFPFEDGNGDYLSNYLCMKEFTFSFHRPIGPFRSNWVTYRILRTSLGDIKRYVTPAFPSGCFEVLPKEIRENKLPQSFVDRIEALKEEAGESCGTCYECQAPAQ